LSHAATIAVPSPETASAPSLGGAFTAFTATISGYFFLACASLYWTTAAAGALIGLVLPRRVIELAPLAWLGGSSLVMAAATQTLTSFFPDYTNPMDIAAEVGLWLSIGFFARCYLVYADYPATFEGLKQSIAERPLERRIASLLHHPIDAIFTRIWVANSFAIVPLTILLVVPATMNYFVIAAYSVMLLLSQFPHELIDHANTHTRVFQPKIGASPRAKRVLKALQFYFENVLSVLLGRVSEYHRIQHVYVHHVEDNGPRDSETTTPYDRTSFLDFSRHAFLQGIDMLTGVFVFNYLRAKGKKRQLREMLQGFLVWYAVLAVIALFNPIAALLALLSRFVGGNVRSLISFWQHGLVDPDDVHDIHGNSVDFIGHEHGNLGADYHVEHHLQPGRHWSAYYEVYSKQAGAEGGHAAVVMQKEMFGPLAFVAALWRKDYLAVARYARLRGVEEGDNEELARIVEERTRPIGGAVRTGLAARIDGWMGRVMARALPTTFGV
jgi:hypothetical protein